MDSLAPELCTCIIEWLGVEGLDVCALVCRFWKGLVERCSLPVTLQSLQQGLIVLNDLQTSMPDREHHVEWLKVMTACYIANPEAVAQTSSFACYARYLQDLPLLITRPYRDCCRIVQKKYHLPPCYKRRRRC